MELLIARWIQSAIRLAGFWREELQAGEIGEIPVTATSPARARGFLHIPAGTGVVCIKGNELRVEAARVIHLNTLEDFKITAQSELVYELFIYEASSLVQLEKPLGIEQLFVKISLSSSVAYDTVTHLRFLSDLWVSETKTARIQATALFHQLVSMWLQEPEEALAQQTTVEAPIAIADEAICLICQFYDQDITLSWLATRLGCSERHLSKQFSMKWLISPIRALTRIRMYMAAMLLQQGYDSLQEIAGKIGYMNGYTVSRLFKDNFKMTPGQYKQLYREGRIVPDSLQDSSISGIVSLLFPVYNDNHNQLDAWGRDTSMFLPKKAYLTTAALLLGASVLLSGCGTSQTTNENGSTNQATPNTEAGADNNKTNNASGTDNSDSDTSANNSGDSAGQSELGNNTTAQGETKLFRDALGEREIPVEPKRIYSFGTTNYLAVLGIHPVGAPKFEIEQDYYLKQLDPPVEIVGDYPPNYEAIMAINPDLIITADIDVTGSGQENYYENLSKIAPVATFEWFGQDVYGQLRQVAAIVGREEQAEAWIQNHLSRAEAAKEKVSKLVGPDETVSIVWITSKDFGLVGNRNIGHVIYNLLGLKPTSQVEKAIADNNGDLVGIHQLSLEKIPDINGDHIIVITNDDADEFYQSMQESQLWKGLPAVRKGNVHLVPYEKWWAYSLLTVDALVDEAVELFE